MSKDKKPFSETAACTLCGERIKVKDLTLNIVNSPRTGICAYE